MTNRAIAAALTLMLACTLDAAAQSVTAPASQTNVAAGEDWATRSLQDPIDMNEMTDLSWFSYSVDQPFTYLAGATHAGCTTIGVSTDPSSRCFRASTIQPGGNLWILEPGNPYSAQLGRNGHNFPIDGNAHRVIAFRLRLSASGNCTHSTLSLGCTTSFLWNRVSLYQSPANNSNAFFSYDGWNVYLIDVTALGQAAGPDAWTGSIGDLRMNLPSLGNAAVEIDWIRVVPNSLPNHSITWSGFAGNVDIYLDSNQNRADGNLGLMVKAGLNSTLPARNQSGGSYAFQPGALAPGDYYVEICPTGTDPITNAGCRHSNGYYRVNAQPTVTFVSPSPEGSADDFATTQLNDAWDMTSLTDIDRAVFVAGLTPAVINAVDEAGTALGNVNVLQGSSVPPGVPGYADPYVYPLWFANPGRGAYKKIDSNRYHILTLEMGIPNQARDINNGSIARIVWQVQGEPGRENVSSDIIINHRAGANVVSKIIADMDLLEIETDPGGSPSHSGWVGNIESFRVDFHEFLAATPFYLKQVKLAANERTAGNSYTIRWSYSDPLNVGGPTMSLYYDTDRDPGSGLNLIVSGLNPAAASSYTWNTIGVPHAAYDIYASVSNGANTNATYARWPIIVDGSTGPLPRFVLSRTSLNFGATSSGQIVTEPQPVTLTFTGGGAGSVQWRATPVDAAGNSLTHLITVTPSTGTGDRSVAIGLNPAANIADGLQGNWAVKFEETVPGATANSAQFVRIFLQTYAPTATQAPIGSFDTPVAGSTVQGSIAVTGWALDDVQVARVEIWRDHVPGEAAPPYPGGGPGRGKIYIANALFVNGARPDVEAGFPTLPLNHRAGWGYLMLTRNLTSIGIGDGAHTLYAFAFDPEGRVSTLGTKAIVVDNANAVKPFGAIDTPGFGQVASGVFANSGWALTPNPLAGGSCTITNGNVWVSVDSGPLVPVSYGDYRPDIQSAFPGFTNSNGAAGGIFLDTTTLTNGTHSIGWLVTDSCGRTDGVGSRFFNVQNGAADQPDAEPAADNAALASLRLSPRVSAEPVSVVRGGGSPGWVYPNAEGVVVVEIPEGERVEVRLPQSAGSLTGAHMVQSARRSLPVGSTFDASSSTFYWQPGPGYLGAYDLWFVPEGSDAAAAPVRLRVVVGPPMRMAVDVPAHGDVVSSSFVVAGWAGDLAAIEGTGVDTVHVWAYPASGGQPIFLGAASYGDLRPDVGLVYGKAMERSSFGLLANGLAPGVYDIAAFPHRIATGRFDVAQVVRVVVH